MKLTKHEFFIVVCCSNTAKRWCTALVLEVHIKCIASADGKSVHMPST